jgi:hypothetical protein
MLPNTPAFKDADEEAGCRWLKQVDKPSNLVLGLDLRESTWKRRCKDKARGCLMLYDPGAIATGVHSELRISYWLASNIQSAKSNEFETGVWQPLVGGGTQVSSNHNQL